MTISLSMKDAAGTVKNSNMGYQRSPDPTKAIDRVRLWKLVLSCLRRNVPWTDKVKQLSRLHEISAPSQEKLTGKDVICRLSAEQKRKRCVIRDDGERRAE